MAPEEIAGRERFAGANQRASVQKAQPTVLVRHSTATKGPANEQLATD